MKSILVADPHCGLNKDNVIFHNLLIALFQEISDTCIRRSISNISILGDLFHNRKALSQISLQTIQQMIDICSNQNLYILRGNHDTYFDGYKNPFPNWLTNLKKYDNVITIENEPYCIEDVCFAPWGTDVTVLNWDKFVFGHFEIQAFPMNDGTECFNGKYNIEDFRKFKHVYTGHFHWPSTKENITYLGSPFQQSFNDCGSERGYYIFDGGELEFIPFTSPKFIKINTKHLNENLDKIKNNFIKLIFDKDYGTVKNNKIIEKIENIGPENLLIDVSKIEQLNSLIQVVEDDHDVKTNDDLLFDFLDAQELPEHIKRGTLYKILRNLLRQIDE